MSTIITKKDVQERLFELHMNMSEAADRMGMTRQNFSKHMAKDPLSDSFVRHFKEVFAKPASAVMLEHDSEHHGVPYYTLDVSASNVDIFNDHTEAPSSYINVPGFEDCEMSLPVFGHSMYPNYENGCIIFCKRIRDLDVISYGEAHLIITAEQRMIKRIRKAEKADCVLLTSDNTETVREGKFKYESFEIKKSKIKHLFLIKGSIKRNQI